MTYFSNDDELAVFQWTGSNLAAFQSTFDTGELNFSSWEYDYIGETWTNVAYVPDQWVDGDNALHFLFQPVGVYVVPVDFYIVYRPAGVAGLLNNVIMNEHGISATNLAAMYTEGA